MDCAGADSRDSIKPLCLVSDFEVFLPQIFAIFIVKIMPYHENKSCSSDSYHYFEYCIISVSEVSKKLYDKVEIFLKDSLIAQYSNSWGEDIDKLSHKY